MTFAFTLLKLLRTSSNRNEKVKYEQVEQALNQNVEVLHPHYVAIILISHKKKGLVCSTNYSTDLHCDHQYEERVHLSFSIQSVALPEQLNKPVVNF
jgi:hypothetical protein